MSNAITVTLLCKPYIRQWLTVQHGSPVNLPRRSNFKNTLLSCLSKDFYPHREKIKAPYTAEVKLVLNKDLVQQYGHTIAPASQNHINATIEEYFNLQLYTFIVGSVLLGSTVDESVRTFQLINGIDEETYSLTSIRRKYFRIKDFYENNFRKSVTKNKSDAIKRNPYQPGTLFG